MGQNDSCLGRASVKDVCGTVKVKQMSSAHRGPKAPAPQLQLPTQ